MKEMTAKLCYKQHGGSGYNFSQTEIAEMSLEDIVWYSDKLDEMRDAEAKAIRKANKGSR